MSSIFGLLLLAPGVVAIASASLTITTPQGGIRTSNNQPPINGTSTDTLEPVSVNVYSGPSAGGTPVQAQSVPVSPLGETWEASSLGSLADGEYTVVAEQSSNGSAATTFTVDTTAPAVTIQQPKTPTNNPTPTLSGSGGELPGDGTAVQVTIYAGATLGGEKVAGNSVNVAGGTWSYTSSSLPDGTYTAQATQEDTAGNVGRSAAVTFTVDTAPPEVTIAQPPSPSKDATPTLSGTAGRPPGAVAEVVLTIHEGRSLEGHVVETKTVPVSEAGQWSYTTPHLGDGTYTAQAAQSDEAANTGTSGPVSFTVDTLAPVVTIVQPGTPTSYPRPTLRGAAGELPGDVGSVRVTIYIGNGVGGVEEASRNVDVGRGQWSFSTPTLPDGTYTAQAVQEDTAGNVGRSAAVTFTVDTNAPAVSIAPVPSPSNDPTPTFSGVAGRPPADQEVELTIYEGTSVEGPVVETRSLPVSEGEWSYLTPHLADGVYTARVKQGNSNNNFAAAAVELVIDTKPPALTLSSPSNDALLETSRPTFSGRAGTASGDHAAVKLRIYAGASTAGSPIQAFEVAPSGTTWTSATAGPTLGNGIYTVVAEQTDEAGNAALGTITFAIAVPVPPAPPRAPSPPVASFQTFPALPHVGEPVSLVSTSSDIDSPITAFSWALASGEPLTAGEHVLTTTFKTSGAHLVRLRVTDANGLSSEVTETVTVAPTVLRLMQPFPVVRIAGSVSSASVRITLFTVQAPVGAKVSVVCHGHGCPAHSQSFVLARSAKVRGATRLVSLGRFERSLSAGAVLEVRVSQAGEIGKYTRFTVRRGRLPVRLDTCLGLSGTKPMTCPTT